MKIQPKGIKGLLVAGLLTASLGIAGYVGIDRSPDALAAGQACTWIGAGEDNNFSTVTNWENCEGGTPGNGDTIRFARQEALENDVNLTNDLDVSLGGMVVANYDNGGGWGKYIIDKLTFANGSHIVAERESSGAFRGTGVFVHTIEGRGSLTLGGALVSNHFNSEGAEEWTRYDVEGMITAEASLLVDPSSKAASVVIIPSSSTGGMGGFGPSISNFSYQSLTVQRGASVTLNGDYSKPLTLGGGSGADPVVNFYAKTIDYEAVDTVISWTSPVTLTSNAEVYVGQKTTVNFTGALTGAGHVITKSSASQGVFNNNPSSNDTDSETGVIENVAKDTKLEGNTNDHVTVVGKETATLLGTRNSISVLDGGVLKGIGTITTYLDVGTGGTLAPGMSPGCITTGVLSLNGVYQVELGGLDACSGYDQIKVAGMDVSYEYDAVNIGEVATLSLFGYGSFVQQEGDVFIIIDNQTDIDVKGTFKDLPEGAEVKVGDAIFTISYVGGDGNDVVLTAQNSAQLPGVPNTGIAQIVSSNPVIVAAAGVLALGAMVAVARMRAQN